MVASLKTADQIAFRRKSIHNRLTTIFISVEI